MTKEEQLQNFRRQRSKEIELILNDNELNLLKNQRYIKDKILENCWDIEFIAVNKHDQDEDLEIHQLKTLHYHVVIVFRNNPSFGGVLNLITNVFHINENQISIMKINKHVPQRTRYLCHIDDIEKHRYNKEDISTNNIEKVNRYFELKHITDNAELVNIVKNVYHYDIEEMMLHIDNYKDYRQLINDLIMNHNRKW